MPAIVVAAAAAAAALPSGETTRLKHLQNRIIGNSTEKARLAANDAAVSDIVDDLNDESHNNTELRIASANIIASLATGSDVALKSLLHAKAHQALLYAISRMSPITEPRLRIAFARALKAVGTAVADAVGPSWWALGPDTIPGRDAARVALEECLNEAAQDVYLPLLVDDCTAVVTAICDMLGQMLRVKVHRLTVSDWLPPADREHEHKRVKRGWERTDVQPHAPRRNGGWVTRQLVTLLSTKDIKLLEATLFALAAVSKDNLPVAKALTVLPHPEAEPIVGIVMQLARSRYVDIQVAACFCAAQIFAAMNSVAHPIIPHPQLNPTPQAYSLSEAQLTLVHVLNQAISSPEFKPLARGRACFTLALLVSGEPQLAQMVAECGSVGVLAAATVAATPSGIDMEEEESKEAAFFREGLLTAAAALTLPSESNRQKLGTNADFANALAAALRHPASGVRHAACLCLRGITRSVHVLRTAVLDADLGPRLFEIVCREHEDRRVQIASLAAMCNLISMEHSPARFELLQRGGIDRLVEFIRSSEDAMRVNAAWAIANCLHKATAKEKRIVITKLGWDTLRSLLSSANEDLREQAVAILINYSSTQAGDAVDHIGQDNLVSTLDTVLSSRSSGLVCRGIEAMLVLMNGAPGPALLTRVRDLLGHKDVAVRRAAAKSVSDLLELNGGLYSAIKDAGIESTLKAMHGPSHIGQQNLHLAALQWQPGMEEDAEVRRQVSMALQHLENYSSDDDLDAAMMDRS